MTDNPVCWTRSETGSGGSTAASGPKKAYVDRIRRFVSHHNKRHPPGMGAVEAEAFLTHLAVAKRVSASTQNQAKSAVLFLYKEGLCGGSKASSWREGGSASRSS